MGTTNGEGEALSRVQKRLVSEIEVALRRRTLAESKLAGAARVIAPYSATVRSALATAGSVLVRRASHERALYSGALRALAEVCDKRAVPLLEQALGSDEAGGLAALSAACFTRDRHLSDPLAKAALARQAHVSFAAEVARLARGEPVGHHLTSLAPMIKESHRIALCVDLFLPLSRAPGLPPGIGPALSVLRGAERHLGRWLVLAEVARRAGDRAPLDEALERSRVGPQSARAAWSLVAWALDPDGAPPTARPTVELIARLSDRPSADRDTSFLFRLAAAAVPSARSMLESMVRVRPLNDEVAVRAAGALFARFGRGDMVEPLAAAATSCKREDVRGVAVAALWDGVCARDAVAASGSAAGRVGEAPSRDEILALAKPLLASKTLGAQVWGALVLRAGKKPNGAVLDEVSFRRVQWGWVE